MKLVIALMLAVFAVSAAAGCRSEAAVDTDGKAASQVPTPR